MLDLVVISNNIAYWQSLASSMGVSTMEAIQSLGANLVVG